MNLCFLAFIETSGFGDRFCIFYRFRSTIITVFSNAFVSTRHFKYFHTPSTGRIERFLWQ